jgi:hypothetical protein
LYEEIYKQHKSSKTYCGPVLPPGSRNWQQILAADTGSRYWQQKLAADTGSRNWQQILAAETGSRYWQQILAADTGSSAMLNFHVQNKSVVISL